MTQQTVVSFAVLASVSMLVALFGPTKFGEDFLHNDQVYVPETKVHTHTKTYEVNNLFLFDSFLYFF